MNRYTLAAITAATLTASTTFAGSTSSAALGSITWQLIDLNPLDNVAPSITFLAGGGGNDTYAHTYAYQSNPFAQSQQQNWGSGNWAPVNSSSSTSLAWATASLTGSGIGSAVLSASGASATPVSAYQYDLAYYQGQAYNGYNGYSSFTLSANTLVTFSAAATISGSAQAAGAPNGAHAQAQAWFDVWGPGILGNGNQSSNDTLYQNIYAYGNPSQSFSDSRTLGVSFLNLTAGDMTGTLRAGAYAYGYSNAAPVPEPESYALLLAGLGLLGLVAGRRRIKYPD
jgi:hypothetical protein